MLMIKKLGTTEQTEVFMVFNVLDYGAKAQKGFVNTAAIQSAIDSCAENGGGQVVVPMGEFVTGGIRLRSHVHLFLEAGAVLHASADINDYPSVQNLSSEPKCDLGTLIYVNGEEDFSIDGHGIILGNGQEDWGAWWGISHPIPFRVVTILAENCKNFKLLNFTILFSEFWTVHLHRCEDVRVYGITIRNNFHRLNSDGIDPDSCKNVVISDCNIHAGDDCICLKSTVENAPIENVVVSNCILESPSTAIKLGTESKSDFRDAHFTNCIVRNSSIGIGIFVKDGALVERISFTNMTIECAAREKVKPVIPLYIDVEKRHQTSKIGKVRDIQFSNLQISSGSGALLQGMPESHLENVTLSDVTFRVGHEVDFSTRKKQLGGARTAKGDERDTLYIRKPAYISMAHVDGLTVRNVTVAQQGEAAKLDMSALYLHDVTDCDITAVRHTSTGEIKAPVIIEE